MSHWETSLKKLDEFLHCWASFVPKASRECFTFQAMYHGQVPGSRNALTWRGSASPTLPASYS